MLSEHPEHTGRLSRGPESAGHPTVVNPRQPSETRRLTLFVMLLLELGPFAMRGLRAQQRASEMSRPRLPYVDQHVCPFEGCSYRTWTARKRIEVYDTWRGGRRQLTSIRRGQTIDAIDGLVITERPGMIRMDDDLPTRGLRKGDTVLVYTYHGEFVSSVWVRGLFYPEMDLSFARGMDGGGCTARCAGTYIDAGASVWWARIRTSRGTVGWTRAAGAFDGQDLLAGPGTPR